MFISVTRVCLVGLLLLRLRAKKNFWVREWGKTGKQENVRATISTAQPIHDETDKAKIGGTPHMSQWFQGGKVHGSIQQSDMKEVWWFLFVPEEDLLDKDGMNG
ncbi:hypothetical protein Daesc_009861 [Daldinia eschscholtzii]|uniref:Secreted protein n=1 Tax=Daldinia eschscholtzii TaxID=292717 RepID=A0AAX6M6W3_9PEZI